MLVDAALREPDPNAFGAIQWAIVRAGDAAIPRLEPALDDPSATRRHRAIEALEKIDSPATRAVIAKAVGHDDPHIRSRAHFACGRSGDAASIVPLVELVALGHEDVEASDVLAQLAVQHHFAAAIVQSIAAATRSADAKGRGRLAAALASVPGDEAMELLDRLAQDPEPSVALMARGLRKQRLASEAPPRA